MSARAGMAIVLVMKCTCSAYLVPVARPSCSAGLEHAGLCLARAQRLGIRTASMVADPRKDQRKAYIRGAAYSILTATALFALAQAPTWQMLINAEMRKAQVANIMSADPALQHETLLLVSSNFARSTPPPPPPATPIVKFSAFEDYLKRLNDKYTRIVESAELAELERAFGSVPVMLREEGDDLVVASTDAVERTAVGKEQHAGLEGKRSLLSAGDRVTSIQGVPTDGMSVFEAADLLESATSPAATVEKDGTGDVLVALRASPQSSSDVESSTQTVGNVRVGYVRVRKFTAGVASAVGAAVDAARGETDVWVLDLRGNSGGLVREAQRTAGVFLGAGQDLVSVSAPGLSSAQVPIPTLLPKEWAAQDAGDGSSARTGARQDKRVGDEKGVVVVMDEASASASEFVAVALEEGRGAVVAGKTSRGKALIQGLFPLHDPRLAMAGQRSEAASAAGPLAACRPSSLAHTPAAPWHVDLIPVKNDGGTVDTCLTNVGGRGLTVSSIAGPYLGDRECGTINCRDS